MTELEKKLWQTIEPVVTSSGRELVDLSFHRQPSGWTLRLVVDQPGGVSVEDCASLSRQISALLDVEDFFDQSYRLEVSSPGVERPLTRLEHFQRFTGRQIRVRIREPLEGKKEFRGKLLAADQQKITIFADGQQREISFDKIQKANLIFEWPGDSSKKKEGE